MKGRVLVAVLAAVLTIGVASSAEAQAKAPAAKKGQAAQAAQGGAQGGSRKPAARKVVRLEEMRVEGRIQKPQALFLMPRANVSSGGQQDRTESFVAKAKDAVEKDPF